MPGDERSGKKGQQQNIRRLSSVGKPNYFACAQHPPIFRRSLLMPKFSLYPVYEKHVANLNDIDFIKFISYYA